MSAPKVTVTVEHDHGLVETWFGHGDVDYASDPVFPRSQVKWTDVRVIRHRDQERAS